MTKENIENNEKGKELDGSKVNPNPDGGGENKKTYTEEEYKTVLSESITRRKEIETLAAKLKKFEDEKLTESEKKDKLIKELEEKISVMENSSRDEKINNLILKNLAGKNIVDSDTAMLIAKKELAEIADIKDIDGKTVSKIIDDILKAKPFLISNPDPNPSSGNFINSSKDTSQDVDVLFGNMIRGKK